MIYTYFKTAWRNISRNILNSAINIFGLAAGMVFSLLILAFIFQEMNVNRSLRNADRQYFLRSVWKDPNLGMDITTFGPIAKRLKTDYPNLVENYYRWDGLTSVVSKGDKHLRENIQLGDSTLLSMYSFQLLHGNASSALIDPYSVVITKEIAIKYFGRTDVTGETISIQSFNGSEREFRITGVLKDMPENSVTRLNAENHNSLFIPTNTSAYFGRLDFDNWANLYLPSYIELKPKASKEAVEKAIVKLLKDNTPASISSNLDVKLDPLTSYYLTRNNGMVSRTLLTLGFVALFILSMAIVNFINLSVSNSTTRIKEVGVRKVMGGLKRQIIIQFLTESILVVSIATIIAIFAFPALKPLFESIIGKSVPGLLSFPPYFIFVPIALIFIVGFTAGLYPAIVLSSLQAVDSLKGKLKSIQENVFLRKSLIGFQFGISALVLIAAIVVSMQVSHFFSKSLGYNKEYVVSSQLPRDWSPEGVRKMESIRNQFAALPAVQSVSLSYEIPNGMNGNQPLVYKAGSDSTQAVAMQSLVTDGNYLTTYQIPMLEGSFLDNSEKDSSKVVINETATKALGYNTPAEAVGGMIRIPGAPIVFQIAGVSSDFHFGSMQGRIAPSVFFHVRLANAYRYLSFKLKPGDISRSIEQIQSRWSVLMPSSSFEYTFMDKTLEKLYASELQLKRASYTATALALVIVLLGVLGLVSLSIRKRMKEIAVRKVLGASGANIVSLFLKEYLPVLLIGGLLAIPAGWFLMEKWLSNYVYRIDLNIHPFIIAVLLIGSITAMVIAIRIARASLENPVKNFRAE